MFDGAGLLILQRAPCADGVGQIEEPGAENKSLVLRERHLGFLGRGVAGDLGEAVAHLASGGAGHGQGHELAAGGAGGGETRGIEAGEAAGIPWSGEDNQHVAHSQTVSLQRADVSELVVVGVGEQELAQVLASWVEAGVGAGVEHGLVDRAGGGDATVVGDDGYDFAGSDAGAVVHQHLRERREHGVVHRSMLTPGSRGQAAGGGNRPASRASDLTDEPLLVEDDMRTTAMTVALGVAAGMTMVGCASGPQRERTPGERGALTGAWAAAAYERFKALEGMWGGDSTKGWNERITYKVIAGGSAVLESSFDAHPGEQMVTMIHPDSGRLMLTHYCVARNQPRLVLTGADENAGVYTFEFLDATNLPTRDKGHMDKVVFKFIDGDHFSSQWTWYEKGKEAWMEEIRHMRVKN